MLGYRDEMEQMLSKANPGLARRFQLENALIFSDYDDAALLNILKGAVKKSELYISHEAAVHAIKQLAKAKALPNFGNAGAVNNLFSDAKLQYYMRQKSLSPADRSDEILAEDFTRAAPVESEEELFSELVGCGNIRAKLQTMQRTIQFAQRRGKADPKSMCEFNYVFTGNPGTGKTTVARLMGKMFCKLGLIPCAEVMEVSASDLVTGYINQAGKKTREMLTKARGKVLFVDEAYQLNPRQGGQFMQEVVDELVRCLTAEDFKEKLVVILAGYDQNMREMLAVNPGLKSRFPETIHFPDFSAQTVQTMLSRRLSSEMLVLDDRAARQLPVIVQQLTSPGILSPFLAQHAVLLWR